MSFYRQFLNIGIAAGLALAAGPSGAQYLYVVDATNNSAAGIDRFSYNFTGTPVFTDAPGSNGRTGFGSASSYASLPNSSGATSNVVGTANDLIVVGDTFGIQRYGLDGSKMSSTTITLNGNAHNLSGTGQAAISADGKYLYVAEQTGAAFGSSTVGCIDKIDLTNGNIVAQQAFKNATNVTMLPDGTILATAYNNSDSHSEGVWRMSADLSSSTKIIAASGTISSPTAVTYVGDSTSGTLYIQQNNGTSAGTILTYSYNLTDNSNSLVNTYATSSGSSILNSFGTDIGSDGNLYIAAFGTNANGLTGSGYGVYKYDVGTSPSSPASSLSIAGGLSGYSTTGLFAPKYLTFDTSFAPIMDAGTPEPGPLSIMFGLCAASTFALKRRVKRAA